MPGITDVETSHDAGIPQQEISIDRDKVADLGLSVRDVTEVLETAVAGSKAGEFRAAGQFLPHFRAAQGCREAVPGRNSRSDPDHGSGEQVALRNVVTSEAGRGPILIDRKDQQRLVTVQANVAGRDLGSVAADVQSVLDQIPRPVGYDLMVAGKFEEQQKAFRELVVSLVLALMLVYMVLACQYESLRDPLVVMVSVPVAAVGVLLILFLTRTTLNLQSYIGCIMLGGIVVNNAILLVDQAGQLVDARHDTARGGGRGRPAAAAADTDDDPDDHTRPAAPGPRHRRRGGCPGAAGPGGDRRPDRLDPDHPGADPGGLFPVSPGTERKERMRFLSVYRSPFCCLSFVHHVAPAALPSTVGISSPGNPPCKSR